MIPTREEMLDIDAKLKAFALSRGLTEADYAAIQLPTSDVVGSTALKCLRWFDAGVPGPTCELRQEVLIESALEAIRMMRGIVNRRAATPAGVKP